MEKAEAEAAPPAAPVLPGDAERDACPCRRGRERSSRSYWHIILVVMSWIRAARREPVYFDRWCATGTFIAFKY